MAKDGEGKGRVDPVALRVFPDRLSLPAQSSLAKQGVDGSIQRALSFAVIGQPTDVPRIRARLRLGGGSGPRDRQSK